MIDEHQATGPAGNFPAGPVAVVVVAGGAGRRLGGIDKPGLIRRGVSLVDRVLEAAPVGAVRVLVGPSRAVPDDVRQTVEDPPGSGPAAAVAAAVDLLAELPGDTVVVLLAGDLAGVDRRAVLRLLDRLPGPGSAVVAEVEGRAQYLFSAVRADTLRARLAERESWTGAALRSLFQGWALDRLRLPTAWTADVDVPEDLRRWGIDPTDTDRTRPRP